VSAVVQSAESRQAVEALQVELSKLPQVELPTEHIFHGGMYCRQLFQPAGSLVVGKVHKKEHFFMVVQGTVAVTGDGETLLYTAPFMLTSKPGTKRALYAETDVVYMTIHRADSTTVEAVEDELVENDPTSMFAVGNKIKPIEVLTWPL
jgi:hypothetical protein